MSAQLKSPPSLHDIVLPEPVSWMPQTIGWWVVLGLLLVVVAWAAWAAVRRRRANRYRRLALARLEAIERALAAPASRAGALAELAVLVKETALACRPRAEVAALSGEPWLRFLDASYGGTGFTEGPGRLLPVLAYQAWPSRGVEESTSRRVEEVTEQIPELLRLVHHWILRHNPQTPSTS
jgi:Flp pilus assembly protein TadB